MVKAIEKSPVITYKVRDPGCFKKGRKLNGLNQAHAPPDRSPKPHQSL
jgi:hypothetical protein